MTTIEENGFFTVLIEFEVNPENQKALIDEIGHEVELHFKSYPGFISASFHASEDGHRVVNYAQWRSKEDWSEHLIKNQKSDVGLAISRVIKSYNAKSKIDTFLVARVIGNK